jgi:hypothetical protein
VQIDNPSITFVLTTWEKKGTAVATEFTQKSTDTMRSVSLFKIDENVWRKYPDQNIIDGVSGLFLAKLAGKAWYDEDMSSVEKARKKQYKGIKRNILFV